MASKPKRSKASTTGARSKSSKQSEAQREHALLSWSIIEWKTAYYMPERVHTARREALTISDEEYDAHEQRYLTLCRELGEPNTVVHKSYPGFADVGTADAMVEVDLERASVRLCLAKLGSPLKTRKKRKPKVAAV